MIYDELVQIYIMMHEVAGLEFIFTAEDELQEIKYRLWGLAEFLTREINAAFLLENELHIEEK